MGYLASQPHQRSSWWITPHRHDTKGHLVDVPDGTAATLQQTEQPTHAAASQRSIASSSCGTNSATGNWLP